MRVFVAVWPVPEVMAVLERIERPDLPAVRWTTREQWHVTLRFLGEVPEVELTALVDAVRAVSASHPPRRTELGPSTVRLGRRTLVVPVAGLDDLGAAVVHATSTIGSPPDRRPFRAHLTLARAVRDQPIPRQLAGHVLHATWMTEEVTLVRSHLEPTDARYEVLATVPLGG